MPPTNCPLCSAQMSPSSARMLNNISQRRYSPIFDNIKVFTCDACDSSWAENCPTDEALGTYYSSTYPVARPIGLDNLSKNWDSRSTSLIALGRLFCPFPKGGFFLDIGPGGGNALAMAEYMLPKPKLSCLEFNKSAISFLRSKFTQILVRQSVDDLMEDGLEGMINFVYSAHCFEHFPILALREQLTKLNRLMARNAVLAIEVPHVHSARFIAAKNHAPHLIFFSRAGLTALLEAFGFRVELCVPVFGRNKWGSQYVERNLGRFTDNEPQAFIERMSAFNTGDLLATEDGPVLKCIAIKDSNVARIERA